MNNISLVSIDKSADYQSKIQSSFAEKVSSIKDNSITTPNILGSVPAVKVEISALGAEEMEKVRQSWNNHSVSALYRSDIPISTNADGVYRIGKVDFSEKEYETARDLVTGMASQLKHGTLGYNDYTKMALAESLVDKCAVASFSEDQRQVIVKAMQNYNKQLLNLNNEMVSNPGYIKEEDETAKQYWGLRELIPEAVKDAMKSLFGRRPNATSAVTGVATNQELIEKLQRKVKETDLTEKAGLDEFRTFYQSVMKPAYEAQYPNEMRADSKAAVELDINGPDGMMRMVDFAKKCLNP